VRSKAGPQEAAACVTIVGYIRWGSWLDGLAEFTCPFFTLYCASITTYAGLRMAAGRVRGGYPRISGLRVSGSGFDFRPWFCGFGYPKYFGFGAGFRFCPRSSTGSPKQTSPIKAH